MGDSGSWWAVRGCIGLSSAGAVAGEAVHALKTKTWLVGRIQCQLGTLGTDRGIPDSHTAAAAVAVAADEECGAEGYSHTVTAVTVDLVACSHCNHSAGAWSDDEYQFTGTGGIG